MIIFFFKQKTAYEMRISDWSSDVCSSDLPDAAAARASNRQDVYSRVTDKIIADLEQGARPWVKPWNADHLAGRITRPLRHNGTPYRGINVVMLWMAAAAQGHACPMWMTFRQAKEHGGFVRKGETGALVVYARSEEHTSELQSLMRISYAVFGLKKKNHRN